jgi:catechol 2,3-dioxygenase
MRAQELGHAVFYVKDLKRSLAFYRDVLGFQVIGDAFGGKAAALVGNSHRTHHELLLIEVGDLPGPAPRRRGLYHIGIKVGESKEELRKAVADLQKAGVDIDGASDHTVSWSLYIRDPDGNEIELYCDNPAVDWRKQPELAMAPIRRLEL